MLSSRWAWMTYSCRVYEENYSFEVLFLHQDIQVHCMHMLWFSPCFLRGVPLCTYCITHSTWWLGFYKYKHTHTQYYFHFLFYSWKKSRDHMLLVKRSNKLKLFQVRSPSSKHVGLLFLNLKQIEEFFEKIYKWKKNSWKWKKKFKI